MFFLLECYAINTFKVMKEEGHVSKGKKPIKKAKDKFIRTPLDKFGCFMGDQHHGTDCGYCYSKLVGGGWRFPISAVDHTHTGPRPGPFLDHSFYPPITQWENKLS